MDTVVLNQSHSSALTLSDTPLVQNTLEELQALQTRNKGSRGRPVQLALPYLKPEEVIRYGMRPSRLIRVWLTRKFAVSLVVILASTMIASVLHAEPLTGKWEYKNSTCDESSLNSLGNDGWELVSISPPMVFKFSGSLIETPQDPPERFTIIKIGPDQNGDGRQNCIAFLKRPK